jgi:alpha-amylase
VRRSGPWFTLSSLRLTNAETLPERELFAVGEHFTGDPSTLNYPVPGRPSQRVVLERLLVARRDVAYGEQRDYFDDDNVVGWTRLGDADHPRAMAVVMSDGPGGTKRMFVDRIRRAFTDVLGNVGTTVTTGDDGYGEFSSDGGSVSIWVEQ